MTEDFPSHVAIYRLGPKWGVGVMQWSMREERYEPRMQTQRKTRVEVEEIARGWAKQFKLEVETHERQS